LRDYKIQFLTICNLRREDKSGRYLGNPIRVDLFYRGGGIVAFDKRCALILHRIRQLQSNVEELT